VYAVAIAPNGDWLATADDEMARIWDAATGDPGHRGRAYRLGDRGGDRAAWQLASHRQPRRDGTDLGRRHRATPGRDARRQPHDYLCLACTGKLAVGGRGGLYWRIPVNPTSSSRASSLSSHDPAPRRSPPTCGYCRHHPSQGAAARQPDGSRVPGRPARHACTGATPAVSAPGQLLTDGRCKAREPRVKRTRHRTQLLGERITRSAASSARSPAPGANQQPRPQRREAAPFWLR
jgi:hypothetical protein